MLFFKIFKGQAPRFSFQFELVVSIPNLSPKTLNTEFAQDRLGQWVNKTIFFLSYTCFNIYANVLLTRNRRQLCRKKIARRRTLFPRCNAAGLRRRTDCGPSAIGTGGGNGGVNGAGTGAQGPRSAEASARAAAEAIVRTRAVQSVRACRRRHRVAGPGAAARTHDRRLCTHTRTAVLYVPANRRYRGRVVVGSRRDRGHRRGRRFECLVKYPPSRDQICSLPQHLPIVIGRFSASDLRDNGFSRPRIVRIFRSRRFLRYSLKSRSVLFFVRDVNNALSGVDDNADCRANPVAQCASVRGQNIFNLIAGVRFVLRLACIAAGAPWINLCVTRQVTIGRQSLHVLFQY